MKNGTPTPFCHHQRPFVWAEGAPAGGDFVERMTFQDTEIRLSEAFTPIERVAISADGNLQRIVR